MLIDSKKDIEVASWMGDFRKYLVDEGKSVNTVQAYLRVIQTFADWFAQANGQEMSPELMNSTDVRNFNAWNRDVAELSPATCNLRRAVLSVFCGWLQDEKHLVMFSFKKIKKAEEVKQAPRWLEASERNAVLRQIEQDVNAANTLFRKNRAIRDAAITAIMIFSGLRVGEVIALEIGDVTISPRAGKVNIRHGKGNKQRKVDLSSDTRDWLSMWLDLRRGETDPRAALFVDEHGKPIQTTRAIEKRVASLKRRCGVEDLTPHVLRHTCLKNIVDAGHPLTEVQLIAGHSRLETTARYVKPGQEDLASAIEDGQLGKMAKVKSMNAKGTNREGAK